MKNFISVVPFKAVGLSYRIAHICAALYIQIQLPAWPADIVFYIRLVSRPYVLYRLFHVSACLYLS